MFNMNLEMLLALVFFMNAVISVLGLPAPTFGLFGVIFFIITMILRSNACGSAKVVCHTIISCALEILVLISIDKPREQYIILLRALHASPSAVVGSSLASAGEDLPCGVKANKTHTAQTSPATATTSTNDNVRSSASARHANPITPSAKAHAGLEVDVSPTATETTLYSPAAPLGRAPATPITPSPKSRAAVNPSSVVAETTKVSIPAPGSDKAVQTAVYPSLPPSLPRMTETPLDAHHCPNETALATTTAELQELKARVVKQDQVIASHAADLDRVREAAARCVEEELEEAKREWSVEEGLRKDSVAMMQIQLRSACSTAEQYAEAMAVKEEEEEQLREEIARLREELAAARQTAEIPLTPIADAAQLSALRQELDHAKRSLSARDAEISSMRKELDSQASQLSLAASTTARLEDEVAKLAWQASEFASAEGSDSGERAALEVQLDAAHEQVATLEAQLYAAHEQVRAVETEASEQSAAGQAIISGLRDDVVRLRARLGLAIHEQRQWVDPALRSQRRKATRARRMLRRKAVATPLPEESADEIVLVYDTPVHDTDRAEYELVRAFIFATYRTYVQPLRLLPDPIGVLETYWACYAFYRPCIEVVEWWSWTNEGNLLARLPNREEAAFIFERAQVVMAETDARRGKGAGGLWSTMVSDLTNAELDQANAGQAASLASTSSASGSGEGPSTGTAPADSTSGDGGIRQFGANGRVIKPAPKRARKVSGDAAAREQAASALISMSGPVAESPVEPTSPLRAPTPGPSTSANWIGPPLDSSDVEGGYIQVATP